MLNILHYLVLENVILKDILLNPDPESEPDVIRLHREKCDALDRIRELEAQLPEGMKHCTIVFKECEKGHGRLTATNWEDNGRPWCMIGDLGRKLAHAETRQQ